MVPPQVPDRLGKSLGKPTPLGDLIELTKITGRTSAWYPPNWCTSGVGH